MRGEHTNTTEHSCRRSTPKRKAVNEKEKTEAVGGASSIQRVAKSGHSEKEVKQAVLGALRKEIQAIRQGFTTGGYCETETLKEKEKRLHAVLCQELDESCERETREAIEHELAGLCYRPRLVVAQD
jgi:hypothetical protein